MAKVTKQDLDAILKEVQTLLDNEKVQYAKLSKLLSEIDELGLSGVEPLRNYLRNAISEISSQNYVGRNPPDKANDKTIASNIRSVDLFEFAWESKIFGANMYFKFAVNGGIAIVFSVHKSRR